MELLANQRIMKMIADAATHVNVQEDTNMHSNTEREREREREERVNSNLETLFYKNYSLGSVKT